MEGKWFKYVSFRGLNTCLLIAGGVDRGGEGGRAQAFSTPGRGATRYKVTTK